MGKTGAAESVKNPDSCSVDLPLEKMKNVMGGVQLLLLGGSGSLKAVICLNQ